MIRIGSPDDPCFGLPALLRQRALGDARKDRAHAGHRDQNHRQPGGQFVTRAPQLHLEAFGRNLRHRRLLRGTERVQRVDTRVYASTPPVSNVTKLNRHETTVMDVPKNDEKPATT